MRINMSAAGDRGQETTYRSSTAASRWTGSVLIQACRGAMALSSPQRGRCQSHSEDFPPLQGPSRGGPGWGWGFLSLILFSNCHSTRSLPTPIPRLTSPLKALKGEEFLHSSLLPSFPPSLISFGRPISTGTPIARCRQQHSHSACKRGDSNCPAFSRNELSSNLG